MQDSEAKALLISEDGKPTAKYEAYLKYAQLVSEKEQEMNKAREKTQKDFKLFHDWPMTSKVYYDALQQAKDQWLALGYKNEIEQAINTLKATGQDTAFLG
jgi:hypothetical protein